MHQYWGGPNPGLSFLEEMSFQKRPEGDQELAKRREHVSAQRPAGLVEETKRRPETKGQGGVV